MLIPEITGGLGNIMFELASCYGIAKKTGHRFGLHTIPFPSSAHSTIDYMNTILKPWEQFCTSTIPTVQISDSNAYPIPYDEFKKYNDNIVVQVKSTLQHYDYFSQYKDEIIPLFDMQSNVIHKQKYEDIDMSYFLHVRRGDYVNNNFHYIDLTNYYIKSMRHFDNTYNNVVYVFSNDLKWCEDWSLLKDKRCVFVDENEVDSLAIMSQCGKGGIAANSTFSWWGLFLNTSREKLIIPNRYFPHNILYQDGYNCEYFTVVDI